MWGEKTGIFTNADRTVHISDQAVEPPGESRSDFEIFREYAARMNFRDKDGASLVKFAEPEEAFEDFKRITAGRPCDYTPLTYDKLRAGSGIQWGPERLYEDHVFLTGPDDCESYGHDIVSGAQNEEDEYRAHDPRGRAFLKAAEYTPSEEQPGEDYPLLLTTGRTVYHWHTRTKTARAPELERAAPDVWAELAGADADRLGGLRFL